jgi:hypothetical protein
MSDIEVLKDRCAALEGRMQRFYVWVTVIGTVAAAMGFTALYAVRKLNATRDEAVALNEQVQADKDGLQKAQTDLVKLQNDLEIAQERGQTATESRRLLGDVSDFAHSPLQVANPWDSFAYDITQLRSFAIRYAALLGSDPKEDATYAILDGIQADAGLAWSRISLPSTDPSLTWHKQNVPEEFGVLVAKLRDERTQPGGPSNGAMACFEPAFIEWSKRAGISDDVISGAVGKFNLDYCRKVKVYTY